MKIVVLDAYTLNPGEKKVGGIGRTGRSRSAR